MKTNKQTCSQIVKIERKQQATNNFTPENRKQKIDFLKNKYE